MDRMNWNIHNKNMRLFSRYLDEWRESKLGQITPEIGYMYYDIKNNKYLGSSSNLAWRGEFHEKDLDISAINLLNEGCYILPNNSVIKSAYDSFEESEPDSYKTLFCRKYAHGFELFGVVTNEVMTCTEQRFIDRSLYNLSHQICQWVKLKRNIFTQIKDFHSAFKQHRLDSTIEPITYDKSRFNGDLTLTSKEQKIIELLLFQYTQYQIADHRKVSVAAIRRAISTIKKKLGLECMPTSMMMVELKRRGVLSIYAQTLMK